MNMHHLHDGIPGRRGESRRAAVRRGFRVNKRDGVRGRGWGGQFPGRFRREPQRGGGRDDRCARCILGVVVPVRGRACPKETW